jgi:hypothetical protein
MEPSTRVQNTRSRRKKRRAMSYTVTGRDEDDIVGGGATIVLLNHPNGRPQNVLKPGVPTGYGAWKDSTNWARPILTVRKVATTIRFKSGSMTANTTVCLGAATQPSRLPSKSSTLLIHWLFPQDIAFLDSGYRRPHAGNWLLRD